MHIIYKKKHVELTFSWKEIFRIIFKKHIKLNKKSVYTLSTVFAMIIKEMIEQYGDTKEHGVVDLPEENGRIDL
jgi:hypothetical protein